MTNGTPALMAEPEGLQVGVVRAVVRCRPPRGEVGVAGHPAKPGEVLGGGGDPRLPHALDERHAVGAVDLRRVAELPLQRADRLVLGGRARGHDVHHRGKVEVDAGRAAAGGPRSAACRRSSAGDSVPWASAGGIREKPGPWSSCTWPPSWLAATKNRTRAVAAEEASDCDSRGHLPVRGQARRRWCRRTAASRSGRCRPPGRLRRRGPRPCRPGTAGRPAGPRSSGRKPDPGRRPHGGARAAAEGARDADAPDDGPWVAALPAGCGGGCWPRGRIPSRPGSSAWQPAARKARSRRRVMPTASYPHRFRSSRQWASAARLRNYGGQAAPPRPMVASQACACALEDAEVDLEGIGLDAADRPAVGKGRAQLVLADPARAERPPAAGR